MSVARILSSRQDAFQGELFWLLSKYHSQIGPSSFTLTCSSCSCADDLPLSVLFFQFEKLFFCFCCCLQHRGVSESQFSRSSVCLVNRSSIINRPVCLAACQAACTTHLAMGELHLGCLMPVCPGSEALPDDITMTSYVTMDGTFPVGVDTIRETSYRGAEHFTQLSKSFNQGLSFTPNTTFTVQLTDLRRDGFKVDTFSAQAVSIVLASEDCRTVSRYKNLIATTFTISINGKAYKEFHSSNQPTNVLIPLAEDARTLELETSVSGPVSSYEVSRCIRGVWGGAQLTRHPRTFPACRPECQSAAHRGHGLLSCFLDGCRFDRVRLSINDGLRQPYLDMSQSTPGTVIGIDSLPARGHLDIQFQESIGSHPDRFSSGVAVRGSREITFDIPKIRRSLATFGHSYDVFVTKVGLMPLSSPVCQTILSSLSDGGDGGLSPLANFSVKVDGVIRTYSVITHHELQSLPGKEVIVPVPAHAKKLSLSVKYFNLVTRRCTRAVWAGAQLRPAVHLGFRRCQRRCQEDSSNGVHFLSCFLGVCSGLSALHDNPPFFWLRRTTMGAGMDTTGVWSDRRPIWLSHASAPSPRGIGARAPSIMAFDLDAMRLANLTFTTLSLEPGIDQGPGCRRGHIGGEFRVYVDKRLAFARRIAHSRQVGGGEVHIPCANAHRIELITRTAFHPQLSCANAVWANARLWTFLPV